MHFPYFHSVLDFLYHQTFGGISLSSFAASIIKDASEYYSNKEFNELKVIEELECIEKDF